MQIVIKHSMIHLAYCSLDCQIQ